MRIYLIVYLLFSLIFSQSISDYSFSSAESTSLAGAIVSTRGGNWSLYNNPATLVDVEKIVTIGLISAEEVSLVTLINGERFFVNHDYREIEHYILDALN